MRVSVPSLNDPCGEYLTFRDLINCGETQARTGIDNLPTEMESWEALKALSEAILDPVIKNFGPVELTFGFCSPELFKAMTSPKRSAHKLDQHHSHERNTRGNLVCDRLGAAVDFSVAGESMIEVAKWVVSNTKFDRLYVYGDDRPIHVSYGPDRTRQVVLMVPHQTKPNGKQPIPMRANTFLGTSNKSHVARFV
jgi:hypothetical protein